MWAFLVTEIMFFGGFFLAYTLYRNMYPRLANRRAPRLHHARDDQYGRSDLHSLTMALGVHVAQQGARNRSSMQSWRQSSSACVFVGIKVIEYTEHIRRRIPPGHLFTYAGPEAKHAELFFSSTSG